MHHVLQNPLQSRQYQFSTLCSISPGSRQSSTSSPLKTHPSVTQLVQIFVFHPYNTYLEQAPAGSSDSTISPSFSGSGPSGGERHASHHHPSAALSRCGIFYLHRVNIALHNYTLRALLALQLLGQAVAF